MPPPTGRDYRELSLWHDSVPGSLRPRPGLPGDLDVDVAIVGAGFTGLWTAYYLLPKTPSMRISVLDAEIAGFGASGRNGGWCSALFPTGASMMAARYGADAARAHYRAMRESVREVVRVADAERIDADVSLGGTVVLARNRPQLSRARDEVCRGRPVRPWHDVAQRRGCPGTAERCQHGRRHLHAALRGDQSGEASPRPR